MSLLKATQPHFDSAPLVPARLALEDGSVFEGKAFGDTSPRVVGGEVCFNTSLSGYQEILTDPSYAGQIVTMTCPLIGNYGVAGDDDMESKAIHARGFIVRELSHRVSNFRAEKSLAKWLAEQKVVGLTGIDTRALTRRLRVTGAMQGVICTDPAKTDAELVALAKSEPSLDGRNLAAEVSRTDSCGWSENLGAWPPLHGKVAGGKTYKVVALDCGAKHNILRNLADQGFDVTVLPWNTPAKDILAAKPDGVFVSNGPGDPAAVDATIATLGELIKQPKPIPTFGICLGHQMLSLALGAKTYKLKFGHRGGNHPIQNLGTGKVEITAQNHGFAVERESLEKADGEVTHINLNDDTVAGFRHRNLPVFAIQYHPEASPGPHDSRYLFDCFRTMIETGRSPSAKDMDAAQRARIDILPK